MEEMKNIFCQMDRWMMVVMDKWSKFSLLYYVLRDARLLVKNMMITTKIMIYCEDTMSNQCLISWHQLSSLSLLRFIAELIVKHSSCRCDKNVGEISAIDDSFFLLLLFLPPSFFIYAFRTRFKLANCLWKSTQSAWDWVNIAMKGGGQSWMNE